MWGTSTSPALAVGKPLASLASLLSLVKNGATAPDPAAPRGGVRVPEVCPRSPGETRRLLLTDEPEVCQEVPLWQDPSVFLL